MKYIALNGWIYCGFSGEKKPREFIDWAASKGLNGVELTVGDCLPLETTESEARELSAYAKEQGVGLRTLSAGFGWGKWLTSDDAAERAETVEFARKYLKLASWIGAETVLMVPGATRVAWDASHAEVSYLNAWNNLLASLREIAPVAESLGVNVARENVWNRFLGSPMEWKAFLDLAGSSRIGLYFDVGNCCLNTNPADWPEILGDRIKAVHLKNFEESDSAGGLHGFGDDLFRGVVDFGKVFAAFDRVGYAGPFTVEMIPFSRLPDLVMPDTALAEKVARQARELAEC